MSEWTVRRVQTGGWDIVAVVAAGGALGSLARWALAELVAPEFPGAAFPWATVAANVSGSFALGVLMAVVTTGRVRSPYVLAFLGVGVLGGFTTFSTYALDVRTLLVEGEVLLAAAALFGTVVAGLLAVGLGSVLGSALGSVLVRRAGRA